jgi:hypothetical protein
MTELLPQPSIRANIFDNAAGLPLKINQKLDKYHYSYCN